MNSCRNCNFITCPNQGSDDDACDQHQEAEPQFEVYTFNERTGSENIHTFYTQEAADAFLRRQPSHRMAH